MDNFLFRNTENEKHLESAGWLCTQGNLNTSSINAGRIYLALYLTEVTKLSD